MGKFVEDVDGRLVELTNMENLVARAFVSLTTILIPIHGYTRV